jgi:16S rRNA (guanine527-N7)-methyltransferase
MASRGAGGSSRGAARGASSADARETFPYPPHELLEKGLREIGLPAADGAFAPLRVRSLDETIRLIERYIRELELFNAVFDLVGAESGSERGRADLVVRHILDSLSPWKEIARELVSRGAARAACVEGMSDAAASTGSTGSTGSAVSLLPIELADVGSGAGFPGIPLAILFPNVRVTLIERMSKRCSFLENCVAILSLSNVTVLNSELESAEGGKYDVVAFRAFRPLDRAMVRSLLSLVRLRAEEDSENTGGCLAAWKARAEKIREEMAGITDSVGYWEARSLAVPFLGHEERNLVIVEK